MSASLRWLALGDSYTIGEGVDPAQRWPSQLAGRLQAEGLALAPPQYLATTGWSSDELAAALQAAAPVGPFALVSLLIGVNDQYRGQPAPSRRAALQDLLERAIELAGHPARVLLVSIPDWSVGPYARASGRALSRISAEIDAYNQLLQTLALAAGVAWIDITPCSRQYPTELAADGLHPNAAQYQRWSALILPAARRALATTAALESRPTGQHIGDL